MEINGSVALVTGANRGIGAEFVRQLQARGAAKIYAAARRPNTITLEGVIPVALDVTDPDQVRAAAQAAPDLTLLVNNAGVSQAGSLISASMEAIRGEMETNLFGPLALSRAFAPILGDNGGGAIINMNSALSWFSYPGATPYAVSKAAAWSLTDGLRVDLAAQGTQVLGVYPGAVDTDMMAGYEGAMLSPTELVSAVLDGVIAGAREVLFDDNGRQLKASLSQDPAERYGDLIGAASR